ncbi:D-alanyl-D-alanine carboxypeptidase DacA precursor [compost metagenome]
MPVVTDAGVTFIVPKGTTTPQVAAVTKINDASTLVAPIKQGTKVGSVTYTYKVNGMETQEKTVNLITSEEAPKAGWFKLLFRAIGSFFSDLFSGVKNLF